MYSCNSTVYLRTKLKFLCMAGSPGSQQLYLIRNYEPNIIGDELLLNSGAKFQR